MTLDVVLGAIGEEEFGSDGGDGGYRLGNGCGNCNEEESQKLTEDHPYRAG